MFNCSTCHSGQTQSRITQRDLTLFSIHTYLCTWTAITTPTISQKCMLQISQVDGEYEKMNVVITLHKCKRDIEIQRGA